MEIIIASIISIVWSFTYLYCVALMFGYGGSVLAGYRTTTKDVNVLKDHKAILRRAGITGFILLALTHAMILLFLFHLNVWGYVCLALLVPVIILIIYLLNTKVMRARVARVKESKNNEIENT